jgi:hypothetical protein
MILKKQRQETENPGWSKDQATAEKFSLISTLQIPPSAASGGSLTPLPVPGKQY